MQQIFEILGLVVYDLLCLMAILTEKMPTKNMKLLMLNALVDDVVVESPTRPGWQ
jgi:hypothetical protein